MSLHSLRRTTSSSHTPLLGLGIALLAGVVGCSKPSAPKTEVPAEPAKSREQASFDQIVSFMRNMLTDSPTNANNVQRFPANSKNPAIGEAEGVLQYELKVDASPEVIQPENPGEPVRGWIEVTLVSSYSRIQQSTSEESPKKEKEGESKKSAIDDIIIDPDLQIDPPTAEQILESSGAGRESTKKPSGTVVLEPRKETVVFDLEYVDNKWRLANTDVDTNLSSAVKTLETALERQR